MQGRRILIVDDSKEITDILAAAFSRCGARVVVANTGWDAMRQLRHEHLDLVILDLFMPNPDGSKVLEFMRWARPVLLRRTMVLTGHCYDDWAVESVKELGIPVLFKPFALDDLRRAASALVACSLPSLTA